ncbi:MAG: bacterial Ig-like domain-containing protein [Treponema sp.]|nr:bacterial Ig-like domain-containing protein [Treponema sp.]
MRFGKNIPLIKSFFSEKQELEQDAEPEITLIGIQVDGAPSKKLYYVGDDFDSEGLTVTAIYSDTSSKTVTGWTVSGFSSDKVSLGDTQTVTVSYTEGGVTKTEHTSGAFYVASKNARPTSRPMALASGEYAGTLAGGIYYKFGDFPQTISSLSGADSYTKKPVYNGYYLGSDGYFYEKCKENAYEGGYTYSDGSPVAKASSNQEKYFKVEPIKWRVLNPFQGKNKMLVAENMLMANVAFYDYYNVSRKIDDKVVYPNNYKHSKIRAYLNGLSYIVREKEGAEQTENRIFLNKGFLQKAFTARAQKFILTTEIDNAAASTNPFSDANLWNDGKNMFVCENTKDKIFLLSEKEATAGNYGFAEYDDYGRDNSRIRKTTDYAKANFAYQSSGSAFGGWWWLRSPYYYRIDFARDCDDAGSAYDFGIVSTRRGGVVPALSIAIKD